jgi:1-phosphofructokinase family hexose kinase
MREPVILCVSANPGMDRRLHIKSVVVGGINRASSAQGFAGGKAAHVAMAAHALMSKTVWIGFLGGAIGQECAAQMESLGVHAVSVPTAAPTRVNLEIIEESGQITEILEPGGEPAAGEAQDFLRRCSKEIENAGQSAWLVISGRLPSGVAPNLYTSLIEAARAGGVETFLDTSGEALRVSVEAKPQFVKANREEAQELTGQPIRAIADAVAAAQEIIGRGVASAAITLGAEGLIWVETKSGPVWMAQPPRLKVISTVGCGDATLAGFAHAAAQGIAGEKAIRLATACGAANCSAFAPGRIELATVHALLPQIAVKRLPL